MKLPWAELLVILVSAGALGYYAFVFLPRQLHRWRCQSLRAFARAIELRTHGRFGNAETLADLANRVALRLGFSLHERRQLELAVYLRDIGMVGIPYAVLNKEAPLSAIEQMTLAKHPDISAAIVEQIPGLWQVAPLVRLHHVRYQEQMDAPLAAHLLSALDDFLRMATQESSLEALVRLQQGSGTCYHPQIVAAIMEELRTMPLEQGLPLRRSAALWL